MRRLFVLFILVWQAAWATPAGAALGPLDTMVMPGEVIEGHEAVEKTCNSCHMPFRKSEQQTLCLDCHDHAAVAQDVRTRRGFHGRLKDTNCAACHTEHKGRGADIVKLDEKTFDHAKTDFPLKGKHLDPKVRCADCHAKGRKHREAPSECYACHKKDDTHEGGLGKDCRKCHVDRSWKEVRFDHGKTGYPLEGKHLDAACDSCHAKGRYKDTPTQCYACHKKDDDKKGHKGRFGTECKTCHLPKDWTTIRFDHARDAKYPLRGRHATAQCTSCHQGILYKEKLKTACVACHRKDDEQKGHKGRYGTKCETCHIEKDWTSVRFDHDRQTRYPLRGKHATARCTACHQGVLYKEKLQTACIACHKKDDAHKGQEGTKCAQCHNEASWKRTFFDHDLTRFPLLGKHARVACKECHAKPTFKDTKTECVACHRKDDAHERRLGPACEQCHHAGSWKQWRFDHDRQTRFALDGGHEGLHCEACHTKPTDRAPTLAGTCVSCHERDDVHDGRFGRFCEQCHVTSTFEDIKAGMRRAGPRR